MAMLRVNFDAGKDHIGMFEPFLLDAVRDFGPNGYSVEEVRESLAQRSQLAVPVNTLRTLMQRVVKRGYATRDGGRYFPTAKTIPIHDLVARRSEMERRQLELARALCAFGLGAGYTFADAEDALSGVLEFIEHFHVSMALRQSAVTRAEDDTEKSPRAAAVAGFLQDQLTGDGPYAGIIQETLEGFVLQNTLLLKDIAAASRRFDDLEVYLDTGLILGLLGLRGEATEIATKEFVSLLREAGAVPAVFEETLTELRTILSIYEDRLGTSSGRLSLHPTDVTRYFLTHQYSPSDVASETALVERNLKGLGVNVRATPVHREEWTLDEASLATRLADRPNGYDDPRVRHDVACIAGVLTARRGHSSDSIDHAKAIFATTSGLTVKNANGWYAEQGAAGVSPIIHYLELSNLAWIKRPSSATTLKLNELVALCGAALRPSRESWDAFLAYLGRLQESGELSSDEVTAVIVSALADRVLADETLDDDCDAECLAEVVERVKASYEAASKEQVARAQEAAREAEESARRVTGEAESEAQARVAAANERAAAADREALRVRNAVERRARFLAQILCWIPFGVVVLALALGMALTLQAMLTAKAMSWPAWVFAAALAVFGLLGILWGFNLNGWRLSMEEHATEGLRRWLSADAGAD